VLAFSAKLEPASVGLEAVGVPRLSLAGAQTAQTRVSYALDKFAQ